MECSIKTATEFSKEDLQRERLPDVLSQIQRRNARGYSHQSDLWYGSKSITCMGDWKSSGPHTALQALFLLERIAMRQVQGHWTKRLWRRVRSRRRFEWLAFVFSYKIYRFYRCAKFVTKVWLFTPDWHWGLVLPTLGLYDPVLILEVAAIYSSVSYSWSSLYSFPLSCLITHELLQFHT